VILLAYKALQKVVFAKRTQNRLFFIFECSLFLEYAQKNSQSPRFLNHSIFQQESCILTGDGTSVLNRAIVSSTLVPERLPSSVLSAGAGYVTVTATVTFWKSFISRQPACLSVTVTVTVTMGAYFTYKGLCQVCAPINDRNTTPAGTGKGTRIQSR
jgi:hypothetical protein